MSFYIILASFPSMSVRKCLVMTVAHTSIILAKFIVFNMPFPSALNELVVVDVNHVVLDISQCFVSYI